MSISPALHASAKAAYRQALRATSITFAGDLVTRNAFRLKLRNEVVPNASITDPNAYQEKVTLTREIAEVLRKNVVQAVKAEPTNSTEDERWHLKITEHTELGDNESIKNPKPMPSSRSARKRSAPDENEIHPSTSSTSNTPRYYSQLKKAHKERKLPELREEDLEESFVRGSGPGGQSINKTENNVQLLHKPTGIRVTCQETRSLILNRRFARRILMDKLDQIQNPGISKQEMQKAKQIERERRRRKKAKKKEKERAAKEGSSTSADDNLDEE
ncbi:hypothetical protein NLI96_g10259 [Meripilus lineatus]|uniref:Prokaryotic-type class I peptide chain release factors domain-containing protein n=1 Tax=Meripilus lineatus TaxID=2056292 RepID=A0AAD5UWA8_9APHY|nr:hypothetical protein NLI96_g10259 [Physisporinus lineatus]